MRFLLINANSAVKKIFDITAKKAGIVLDVVDSIAKTPLDKDYACIFVDDGVMKTGDIGNFKSKMITTKFCIILSKDSPVISGFDSYIRKPFLPTDIYEALKKEKYSDINNAIDEDDSGAIGGALGDGENEDGEIDANSDIDLSEFNDNDDEFLSGIKETDSPSGIDFSGNPMGDSVPDIESSSESSLGDDFEIPQTDGFDLGESLGEHNESSESSDISADLGDLDLCDATDATNDAQGTTQNANDFAPLDLDLGDSVDLDTLVGDAKNAETKEMGIDLALGEGNSSNDLNNNIALDLPNTNANSALEAKSPTQVLPTKETPPQKSQKDIFEDAESQIRNIKALEDTGGHFYNSSNDHDDIDFSAIMALQDEILKEEAEKKEKAKKSLIGGDISKTKGEAKAENAPQQDLPSELPSLELPQQTPTPSQDAPPPQQDLQDMPSESPTPPLESQSQDSQNIDLGDLNLGDSNADLAENVGDVPLDLAQDSNVQTQDIAMDSVANDSMDFQTPQDSQDSLDLAIDLAQDSQDFASQDSNAPSQAQNLKQMQENGIDLDLGDLGANLAQDSMQDSVIDSQDAMANDAMDSMQTSQDSLDLVDLAMDSSPIDSNPAQDSVDLADSLDATKAENEFLESLDFSSDLGDSNASSESPQADISADLDLAQTQDLMPQDSLETQTLSDSQPQDLQGYDAHKFDDFENFDNFNNVVDEGLDELKGLSAISNIADNAHIEPRSNPKSNDDILNNLEILPDDIQSPSDAAQSANSEVPDLSAFSDGSNYSFNNAFSHGIIAEMDSISPSFKEQDFMSDFSASGDSALPDFTKSLKQATTAEQRYNMLGLPINDDGAVKNINDLSQNELHSLDDEAILLLQEKSLQDKNAPKATQPLDSSPKASPKPKPKPAPKVLDKAQIDDITNILETTQNTPKATTPNKSLNTTPKSAPQEVQKVVINNSEFASLTQEALSEVLGEEALKDAVASVESGEFDDGFMDLTPIVAGDLPSGFSNIAPKNAPNPAPKGINPSVNPPTNPNANQSANPITNQSAISPQINLNDGNLNIAELIQTFPIDKLRELLSGVQITVNITFPTKKQ